jgi:hypothetical protein
MMLMEPREPELQDYLVNLLLGEDAQELTDWQYGMHVEPDEPPIGEDGTC